MFLLFLFLSLLILKRRLSGIRAVGLNSGRLIFNPLSSQKSCWFFCLKDYQRERIIGVFYPERDSLGINYSVIQSNIAIGSAGFWGKGYGQGTQTQLGFLTEPGNDFILAAIVEEWGFLGGIVVVG